MMNTNGREGDRLNKFRVEKDDLGALQIPAAALYGIQTARAMLNLSFSGRLLQHYPMYVKALAMVKHAAAQANFEAGLLSQAMSEAIIQACDEIIAGLHHEHFPVDMLHGGGGIGANMNVNEVVANLANEKLGGSRGNYDPVHPITHVNASQSTSDVCHTAIRMAIILSFNTLSEAVKATVEVTKEKAMQFQDINTIARTCLQDGMRAKLGEKFSAYSTVIQRRLDHLVTTIANLHQVNLGGTVIGSGVGAPKLYRETVLPKLCQVSKLPLSYRENLFDAAQNMDDLAQVSSELCLLATSLIKIAKDLRLLSSGPEAGFGELRLPAVQAGSSFFPGKVNPVIPETLIQCCFQVLGCDRAVQAAIEHGELDLNVFEGLAGANILDAMDMLNKALRLFVEKCLYGIEANKERCEALSTSLIPAVVDLKEKYGYFALAQLLKKEGPEGIKQLLRDGGDTDDTF
ncbi:aspartate ammonia-lyase [Caldalkalibacillus uzonensis]|uniref:Aspartate ammonia-lyase n=1 Tax=Caldalkalibacillus uzonensis TaxID=353224 RepID=A0ABU0CW08_9BACI|nr:lyase family protein [Caldalkalibacillus uzonensis]MDQ0340565.1 aspartate ammonia-lyase [Caldalkalibacillus uzonensis]